MNILAGAKSSSWNPCRRAAADVRLHMYEEISERKDLPAGVAGRVCCGLQLLASWYAASERWCRSCAITVTLDNCRRSPVLVCRNFFQPTSCGHAVQICPGFRVCAVPGMTRCMAGVHFQCMDILCCHSVSPGPPRRKARFST
jgi:hypothetical protein